jgi:hypothetical protein
MSLNHLLVQLIQADRETSIARQQLARHAASQPSSLATRIALVTHISRLLPFR